MKSARSFPNELRGVVDPRLMQRLTEIYNLIYQLQDRQQSTPDTATVVTQQLQQYGLIGSFGQQVIGLTPSSDPQLAELAVSPGTGTVQSVAATSGSSGFSLVASPAPIIGTGTITFSISNAANARTTLGIDEIAAKKSNLTAVVAPTINDDSGVGYAVGSFWIDTTGPAAYMCGDATVGAAVWLAIG